LNFFLKSSSFSPDYFVLQAKSSRPQGSDSGASDTSSSDSSDSESDSESSASGGQPQTVVNGVPVSAQPGSETSDENDSDGESDADSDAPAKAAPPSSDDDDDDSDDQSAPARNAKTNPKEDESSQESSSDSSDGEGDIAMKDGTSTLAAANKRKADADAIPPSKKAKLETSTPSDSASATIWIGNLSWNVDDDWLRTEYEGYGELVSARVQMDRNSGRSRGFAYVEFKDVSAAQAAVDDKTKEIDGRTPRVDFAPPRSAPDQTKRAKAFNDQISEPSSTLFVGNLSFDASEDAYVHLIEPIMMTTDIPLN
jgi:nucleolin